MGGNGAYIHSEGGVPNYKKTHTDTSYRVRGHKVLVLSKNPELSNIPMNSNSDSPIYLCAKVDKQGKLTVKAIAVYENHKVTYVIDIVTDKNGDFIPYTNGGKNSSHSHNWKETDNGDLGRKSHQKNNSLPINSKYQSLINDVINFNKSTKKWTK